jgi:hypothetical protein
MRGLTDAGKAGVRDCVSMSVRRDILIFGAESGDQEGADRGV